MKGKASFIIGGPSRVEERTMKRLILTTLNQNYFFSKFVVFIPKRQSRKTWVFEHCPEGNHLKSIRKDKKPKEEQRRRRFVPYQD